MDFSLQVDGHLKDMSHLYYENIFFSAADNYGRNDSHGVIQLFRYFKDTLKRKSCVFITGQKIFEEDEVFDISKTFNSRSINHLLINENDPSWVGFEKMDELSLEVAKKLPKHKNIILGDPSEICPRFLDIIMNHCKSNIIYLAMVHNNFTGLCAYPVANNCNKFTNKHGCFNCPEKDKEVENLISAIKKYNLTSETIDVQKYVNINLPQIMFNYINDFTEKNKDKIKLICFSSFTKNLAEKSYLYRDVEQHFIPLKILEYDEQAKKDLISKKKELKEAVIQEYRFMLQANEPELFLKSRQIEKICFWTAQHPEVTRKGLHHYIDVMHILKNKYLKEDFEKILFLFSGENSDYQNKFPFFPKGGHYFFTGLVSPSEMIKLFVASDVYSCTTIEDAGPRTIVESIFCGTPTVAFDRSIALDIIKEKTGRIVENLDCDIFAKHVAEILSLSDEDKDTWSNECVKMYDEIYNDEKIKEAWNKAL